MAYNFYQGSDRILYGLAYMGREIGTLFGPPGLSLDEVKRQITENHEAAPTVHLGPGEIPIDRLVRIRLSDEIRMYGPGLQRIQ